MAVCGEKHEGLGQVGARGHRWHDKRVYRKPRCKLNPFFSTAPSVPTSLYSTPPSPLFPFCSLLSSLLCNDHSSALQEPVPFSTACSLIQPALGSSAPVCSSLGGGPHCPSSSQMTTIFHARERPEAFPIMPVWNLSRNSLAHIIINYISFHSHSDDVRCHWGVKDKQKQLGA